jgi:hypothetical protein
VPDDLVDEERRVDPLALQTALHVGQRDDHGVDGARRDRGADLLEVGRPARPHAVGRGVSHVAH